MQAVWIHEFGGPEVLTVRETPDPAPAPGQVVVDVAAASITFIETLVRANKAPFPSGGPQPPYVPGNGVGGTVAALGEGVDPSWLGRRVVSTTGGTGGYATRVAVPAAGLIPVPDGVSLLDATALLADGRTATGLAEAARLAPGDRVLILAAAGGVGTLLIQLTRLAGAYAIGAASPGKQTVIADLGVDEAVDYTSPVWTADLKPVDVVFDGVGGTIGSAAPALLKPGGRILTYGVASGGPARVDRQDVELIGFPVLGAIGQRASEYTARALTLAAEGKLRPVIGQTFPLDQAADAHRAIEERASIGKTLLLVEPARPPE
jgi:NADPH2:quinone reductase